MNTRSPFPIVGLLIGALVLAAIAVGVIAVLRIDPSGEQGSGLSEAFDYDLQQYQKIDPALFHYKQTAAISTGMREPRAVAVGSDDRIFVAGDKLMRVFAPDGAKLKEIALESEPQCLTIGNAEHAFPGRTYVGMKDHVEVYDPSGSRIASWAGRGEKAVLTSLAAAENDVFAADAGAKIVWRFDTDGKLLGRIGQRDESRNVPGFVIPSPYFDVAVAPDGLLRAVNPGWHRIEAYTFDGHLETFWGRSGMGIAAFCGCCNPSNIAILPDGRVVTAEKGIPRVKVYSAAGQFESVVIGPETLAPNPSATVETRAEHKLRPVDVAADSRGRILVLDPAAASVRVFEHK